MPKRIVPTHSHTIHKAQSTLTMAPTPPSKSGLKRKHVTLTISDKLDISKCYEQGVKVSIVAQEHTIGNFIIYEVIKQSKELKAYPSAGETMKGCDKQLWKLWMKAFMTGSKTNILRVSLSLGPSS